MTAATLLPPARFAWLGRGSPELAPEVAAAAPAEALRAHLAEALTQRLYEDFYLAGRVVERRSQYAGSRRPAGNPQYVRLLDDANAGQGTSQAGWAVVGHEQDAVVIRREGLTLRAAPSELVVGPAGLGSGAPVALRMPKGLAARLPGFYLALSDVPVPDDTGTTARVYWNLYPDAAPTLVRAATTLLNQSGLPFRLKLLNDPDRYDRCDAAVLYLPAGQLAAAHEAWAALHGAVAGGLKRPVPALTLRLAPGVGFAEEPPSGDSFGQHRCRLLADGIVRGWERGAATVAERLAVVIECFAEAGIDIERPYLNPGSVDDYDFSFAPPMASRAKPPRAGRPADYLQVAHAIGREICREAFWHEGWCNWLGVQPREPSAPAHHGMTYASLGPELYGGSSGVGLFLAELAAATGDEEARRTALGAMRQALGRAETIQPPVQLGLYTGRPGLALVAMRVGRLLAAENVVAGARALLAGLSADFDQPHEHDLLSGSAGAILTLLALRRLLDDEALLTPAISLGDQLLAAAEPDGDGCSWPSSVLPNTPHLLGLAHGAAGIAPALLELSQVTGDLRYRATAERAFAYERRWFNPKEGNWPDFREVSWRAERPGGPFPFPAFWCHGAPGIALSRLHAWQLTGADRYRDEAVAALDTTERAVHAALYDGTVNYSLCHGLCGNAEILMLGYQVLGSGFDRYAQAANEVAASGIEQYAPEGRAWPLGTHGGWTPNLMLGLAGIGRFYLGLTAPDRMPSVMLPTPDAWS